MSNVVVSPSGEIPIGTLAQPLAGNHSYAAIFWLSLRNLWRNKRRTWLTMGGVAFSVFLLVFGLAMQQGTFVTMIESTASMFSGFVTVEHPEHEENPNIDNVMEGSTAIAHFVSELPGKPLVSSRVGVFGLVSHDERSFGAQVMGVEPDIEGQWMNLAISPASGRFLRQPGEVYLGSLLAHNLRIGLGDELVVLGTGKGGGVAAMVAKVVGTFESGDASLDRSMAFADISDIREAWSLRSDEADSVVVHTNSLKAGEQLAREMQSGLAAVATNNHLELSSLRVRDWESLMPELKQMVMLKSGGIYVFFALTAIIVLFSIVNTFMMILFERTREFGMLMSLGMRPGALRAMLHLEALWLALLGCLVGMAISLGLTAVYANVGIPLPESAPDIIQNMPERLYPSVNYMALQVAIVAMVLGTQLAALIPGWKLKKMTPVEALRSDNA